MISVRLLIPGDYESMYGMDVHRIDTSHDYE